MKVYEKKIIPATEHIYVKTRKCDLCGINAKGEEWESTSIYHIDQTEIKITVRQKEGDSYPEGGSGTKYEIDLCPNCFRDRLIPWLKSQGANIQQEKWDW